MLTLASACIVCVTFYWNIIHWSHFTFKAPLMGTYCMKKKCSVIRGGVFFSLFVSCLFQRTQAASNSCFSASCSEWENPFVIAVHIGVCFLFFSFFVLFSLLSGGGSWRLFILILSILSGRVKHSGMVCLPPSLGMFHRLHPLFSLGYVRWWCVVNSRDSFAV